MASRDLESLMWAEAVRMLDRAERVERHFFRPGAPRRAQWEPPVDVYETAEAFWVVIALPGVAADAISVEVDNGALTVVGERRVPAEARAGALHRLEIPHGYFRRRLALPRRPLSLDTRELIDGCLYLSLRKVASYE